MDRVVPSTQRILRDWFQYRDCGLRPRFIPQSVVRHTAILILYSRDWALVSTKMAPVQLLFVYQDDCIFQPYELFLDVEPTCHAEMKPVAWRFVLYPDQFVRECKLAAGR